MAQKNTLNIIDNTSKKLSMAIDKNNLQGFERGENIKSSIMY